MFNANEAPQWTLVIVGMITAAVIAWQSWETRKAAKGSEKSAQAALLNAQALINAERAWIVVHVESPAPNEFHFKVTNVGKTPAKIISICGRVVLVERRNQLELPPEHEMDESLMSTPPCLLPPTASCIAFRSNIEELHRDASVEDWMQYLRLGFCEIFFYGKVRYLDTLEDHSTTVHETQWLYWLLPIQDALPIPDPRRPEHNRYS